LPGPDHTLFVGDQRPVYRTVIELGVNTRVELTAEYARVTG
jgi:hypothetical protein